MKHLKRFNESVDNTESLKEKLKDKVKYTPEDILYYFSEFTDEYEWEYEFILNLNSHRGYGWSINDLIKDGGPHVTIKFTKQYPASLGLIERTIQFGKELEKFNNCFHQFKALEEDIIDVATDIRINGRGANDKGYAEITIDFIKLVPDLLDEFKKNNPEKPNQTNNDIKCHFCDDFGDVPCSRCDGNGFLTDADGNYYNCQDCDGDGIIDCPECQ